MNQTFYCFTFDPEDRGVPAQYCKIKTDITELPGFDFKYISYKATKRSKTIELKRSSFWGNDFKDSDSLRDYDKAVKVSDFLDITDNVVMALKEIWKSSKLNMEEKIRTLDELLKET